MKLFNILFIFILKLCLDTSRYSGNFFERLGFENKQIRYRQMKKKRNLLIFKFLQYYRSPCTSPSTTLVPISL